MHLNPPHVERPRDDRVLPSTRWLAAAILPFLLVASALLYLWPEATDRHFAWTIQPSLSATLLASAYLGGVYFFAEVLRSGRWHRVKHGFPAVAVFSGLVGAATLLHWNRFHAGHVSFITWATLYFTTPFLVLAAWLHNRRTDPKLPEAGDVRLPSALRLLLAVAGAPPLLIGLGLFVWPQALLGVWAWELTPLTARVTGAVLSLPGVVGLSLLGEGRWSAVRVLLGAQLLSLAGVLVALVRARTDLLWERPAAPLVVVGMGSYLVFYAAVYLLLERRRLVSLARSGH